MKKLALIAALSLSAGAAHSQTMTGEQYLSQCENTDTADPVIFGWCTGYLMGAWEGTKGGASRVLAFARGNSEGLDQATDIFLGICQPSGTSFGQMETIFVSYLLRNGGKLDVSARFLLVEALREAFPCE